MPVRKLSRKGSKKRGSKKRCQPGEILRKSYKRGSTRVSPTCIQDKGRPGKGPKTLPPLDKQGSLRKYGYTLKKGSRTRRQSLRKASKKNGSLRVLRRLVLLRNYQADPKYKKELTDDIQFMSKLHANEKK